MLAVYPFLHLILLLISLKVGISFNFPSTISLGLEISYPFQLFQLNYY